ncbi:MAG TPA: isocyanide synthase family protein [Pyrinomonadaceae bacterium]|nr:isocyanide synthase family protein [Pyrinomonadaceae bacterium]
MTDITNPADRRTRQRVLEAAFGLIAQRGLSGELLKDSAALTGYPLDRAKVFFRRDEDLVISFYARLAAELESRISEIPEGDVAARFKAAMLFKFEIVNPHRKALASLLATLLDPRHELGALSPQTQIVRTRVMSVFHAVVAGATNARKTSNPKLVSSLYAAHLCLMLLWSQDQTQDFGATRAALDLVCDVLSLSDKLAWLPNMDKTFGKLDAISTQFVEPEPDLELTKLSTEILTTLFRHRRLQATAGACIDKPCAQCLAIHLPKVRRSIAAGEPVHFLLPAFPAKSPNPTKVLGQLPDMAEEIALTFLERVCGEIKDLYSPGAQITICSDGRVFSDLVGVSDASVSDYAAELKLLMQRIGSRSLDLFGMEDLFDTQDHSAMRDQLVLHYAEPLKNIQGRIHSYEHHRTLFNGIQRFLFEDRLAIETDKSRNQVRNECKDLAYQVIQRSDGWSRLLNDCFPTALRLSIHPQAPHSEKIGILLGEANDTWLTPWHGVAVNQQGKFILMRRHEAEAAGAEIVERDGRPSHFQI